MRIAVLVPRRITRSPGAGPMTRKPRALTEAGASVEAVAWTDAGDLAGFDLVLPLVAWGYHSIIRAGSIFSTAPSEPISR